MNLRELIESGNAPRFQRIEAAMNQLSEEEREQESGAWLDAKLIALYGEDGDFTNLKINNQSP